MIHDEPDPFACICSVELRAQQPSLRTCTWAENYRYTPQGKNHIRFALRLQAGGYKYHGRDTASQKCRDAAERKLHGNHEDIWQGID